MITELAAGVVLGCFVWLPNLCLKNGVVINGAHFESYMVRIIDAARETAPPLEKGIVWITSANDLIHMRNSLHYKNRAFDIRIRNILGDNPGAAGVWAERMQIALGKDYDVVLEADHIHAEFDPKEK
jgi:hypothetical protein